MSFTNSRHWLTHRLLNVYVYVCLLVFIYLAVFFVIVSLLLTTGPCFFILLAQPLSQNQAKVYERQCCGPGSWLWIAKGDFLGLCIRIRNTGEKEVFFLLRSDILIIDFQRLSPSKVKIKKITILTLKHNIRIVDVNCGSGLWPYKIG